MTDCISLVDALTLLYILVHFWTISFIFWEGKLKVPRTVSISTPKQTQEVAGGESLALLIIVKEIKQKSIWHLWRQWTL